jgi:hypothetical protein
MAAGASGHTILTSDWNRFHIDRDLTRGAVANRFAAAALLAPGGEKVDHEIEQVDDT